MKDAHCLTHMDQISGLLVFPIFASGDWESIMTAAYLDSVSFQWTTRVSDLLHDLEQGHERLLTCFLNEQQSLPYKRI